MTKRSRKSGGNEIKQTVPPTLFQLSDVKPPVNITRYRRGLMFTSAAIACVLIAGLKISSVSAGGWLPLTAERPIGVHVVLWIAFGYYFYGYSIAWENINIQVSENKLRDAWLTWIRWRADQKIKQTATEVFGKDARIRHGSSSSYGKKKPGGIADFELVVETQDGTNRPEDVDRLAETESYFVDKNGKLKYRHNYTFDDIRDYEEAFRKARNQNREYLLEHGIPVWTGRFVLGAGLVLYASWVLFPSSTLGQLVPL